MTLAAIFNCFDESFFDEVAILLSSIANLKFCRFYVVHIQDWLCMHGGLLHCTTVDISPHSSALTETLHQL